MESRVVEYKVEKNEKYGDYRIVKYINGIWKDEVDNNYNKEWAERKAKLYRDCLKIGKER